METLKLYTQEEISSQIEIIQSQISLIESMGSRPVPLTEEMIAVLNAAKEDCDVDELDVKEVLLDYFWVKEAALVGMSLRIHLVV